MDWDAITKVAAVGLAAVPGVVRVAFGGGPRGRAKLKADCEILNLLDVSETSYGVVKRHVDEQIVRVYGPRPLEGRRRLMLFSGVAYVLAGVALGAYFYSQDFSWYWYLIPGYLILMAVGALTLGPDIARARALRLEGEYAQLGRQAMEHDNIRADPDLEPTLTRISELRSRMAGDDEATNGSEVGSSSAPVSSGPARPVGGHRERK